MTWNVCVENSVVSDGSTTPRAVAFESGSGYEPNPDAAVYGPYADEGQARQVHHILVMGILQKLKEEWNQRSSLEADSSVNDTPGMSIAHLSPPMTSSPSQDIYSNWEA